MRYEIEGKGGRVRLHQWNLLKVIASTKQESIPVYTS